MRPQRYRSLAPRSLAGGLSELVALSISGMKRITLSFTLAAQRDSTVRRAVQAVRAVLQQEVTLRRDELLDSETDYHTRRTWPAPTS